MATTSQPKKLLCSYQSARTPVPDGWIKQRFYKSQGDKQQVQRVAQEHTDNAPLIWDVEHWVGRTPEKMIELVKWAREIRPELRQSFYSMLPERNYWAPISHDVRPNSTTLAALNAWRDRNAALAPLAREVDIISPSLYTFYRNDDGHFPLQNTWWFIYAKANIDEAKKYGKQVIPWLSPRLWRSAGQEPMDLVFFRSQVDFVLEHADGVMIFDWIANKPTIDLTQMMREIAE